MPQGTGPFSIRQPPTTGEHSLPHADIAEPLGLLHGLDAASAIAAGVAAPLAGGPLAFTLIRCQDRVLSLADAPQSLVHRLASPLPDWAGLGAGPLVMGILNITPDSFSDGGEHFDPARATAAGERMLAEGADILDIGGESTRPGSGAMSETVEQARVLPVITALARLGAVVSIDTRNAGTMARALDAGARIVNDVTGLRHDPAAAPLAAARGCPVVLMHMRGTPATMMSLAVYQDVAAEVRAELSERLEAAVAAGVRREAIMIDPGFGFAKDAGHNLELLQRLPLLLGLGCPILAGLSRKATVGMLSGARDPKRRGPGSLAAALFALQRGARMVRVHDVAETVQAVRVWRALSLASPTSQPALKPD